MSLSSIMAGAGVGVLGVAVCGALVVLAETWTTWRFARRPALTPAVSPPVCVMRPLHGDEPQLHDNLKSLCGQDYGGAMRIVLGVQAAADPAFAAAERLKRDHPDQDIVTVCDAARHGTNRKISNLINMWPHAQGEIIIISDSDVRLPANAVSQMVAALAAPGVGLIYCLHRGRPTGSLWSSLAAMDNNTRFAPSVVFGQAVGGHPCLGPTMALRAEVLADIGGLAHLADFLADDYELGRAVRALGLRIDCPPLVIDHVFPERGLGEVMAHELRWARTIRLVQPAAYVGTVILHSVALALIGAALTGFAGWSLGVLGAVTVFRMVQAYLVCRLLECERTWLWLQPLRDLLSFVVYALAIFGHQVRWRGARLRVASDGAILSDAGEPSSLGRAGP